MNCQHSSVFGSCVFASCWLLISGLIYRSILVFIQEVLFSVMLHCVNEEWITASLNGIVPKHLTNEEKLRISLSRDEDD